MTIAATAAAAATSLGAGATGNKAGTAAAVPWEASSWKSCSVAAASKCTRAVLFTVVWMMVRHPCEKRKTSKERAQ